MTVSNLVADLSDGFGFFSGTVCDISRYGILLDDIPNKLNNQAKKLTVVVSAKGKNFKLLVTPKWVSEKKKCKSIGLEILNVTSDWLDFVRNLEPKEIDNDVWATVAVRN